MAELSSKPVKTFSIGFEEDDFNELEYARIVARLYDTDHEEHIVSQDLIQTVPKLVWHYDEPFGDSSAIPTFHLSKVSRRGVTVALCGDAGDELFCGYTKYPVIERKVTRGPLLQHAATYGKRFLEAVPLDRVKPESIFSRIYSSLFSRTCGPVERDFMWMIYYDNYFKKRLYSKVMADSVSLRSAWQYYCKELAASPDKEIINSIMYADLGNYMLNDLLVKVDIASMANSLEVRSPFLDHEFAQFAASIPTSFKIRNGETKYILKKAFSENLPERIIKRQKMGFAIPVDRWFRGKLMAYAKEIFADEGYSCLEEYFNRSFVLHLMEAHENGKAQYGSKLWLVLMFVLWHMIYVDGKSL
jgi:asparagine synthase (glutamine-hydrolysing)